MAVLKSMTIDTLELGTQASFSKTLEERDLVLYGTTSGDVNPVHFDEPYANTTAFEGRIAHGMWSAGLISACIGTQMPGPGSIYLGQELKFKRPVRIGDTLTANLTVTKKNALKNYVIIDCQVTNQNNELVISGDAKVMPPTNSGEIEAPTLADITIDGMVCLA